MSGRRRPRIPLASWALASVLLTTTGASASPEPVDHLEHQGQVDDTVPTPAPPRTYAAFKVGAATSAVHPQMCAEVTPLEIVGVEACGTGAGFLYDDGSREVAHFRLKGRLAAVDLDVGGDTLRVEPWVLGGFAELQLADDAPGFDFLGTGPLGVETAGPAAGASVRALYPVALGVELVAEAGVSLAWFPYAPLLVEAQAAMQPQASLSLGVGF